MAPVMELSMVLPVEDRKRGLEALRASGKVEGKTRLYYKGRSEPFPTYLIDLDLLVYNRHNGRIESEMLTWQFERDLGEREYNDEIHKRIDDFLWKSNVDRNRHTLADLETKKQQRPGIVSLDGVIIDGNRRAMLLNRIRPRPLFEAVILPDAYYEDEKAIVRLETEFQIGEDSKLDYGPLEKYLKVKRLSNWYELDEIAVMMALGGEGEVNKLNEIMELMDDYLEHIDCPGLYTMLNEDNGSSKEGMFVDLYHDLKRLKAGRAVIPWSVGKMDQLDLKTVQFDFIRLGSGVLDGKDYREISHNAKGSESFFAKQNIWKQFLGRHKAGVEPIDSDVGTLEDYMSRHPHHPTRIDAARARENNWKAGVKGPLKGAFNQAHNELEAEVDKDEPRKLLERALAQLDRIDLRGSALIKDKGNEGLVKRLSSMAWEMKRRFDRPGV
jgi:hypothetical protein